MGSSLWELHDIGHWFLGSQNLKNLQLVGSQILPSLTSQFQSSYIWQVAVKPHSQISSKAYFLGRDGSSVSTPFGSSHNQKVFLALSWNLPPRNSSSSSHPICGISVVRDFSLCSPCHVTHLGDLRADTMTPGICPFSKSIVLIPSAILLRVLSPSCPFLQPVFLSLLSTLAEKSDSKQNKSKWAQTWKKIGKSELRGPSFSWEWNFGFYPRANVKLLLH